MKYYDWLVETMKWDKFSTLHTHKKINGATRATLACNVLIINDILGAGLKKIELLSCTNRAPALECTFYFGYRRKVFCV